MLEFEPIAHVYKWNGAVVPSVTQLLDKHHSFDGVPRDVMDEAKRRGTYVHDLCDADDSDDLDEEGGEFWSYLEAWRRFSADYGANWSFIETRMFSKTFGFAGTLDRAGFLEAKFGVTTRWVVDIKTSEATHRTWGPQIAAYRQQLSEIDPMWILARRASVRLRVDGTYRFDEWTNKLDWPFFQACLTQRNWELST